MNLYNPSHLKKGDIIGIISPSSGLANIFPHRVEKGKRMLENLGFKVIFGKHALERSGYVSASPQDRASDIHDMFVNPDVKAIICTIGGNHANQLLKYLDFDLIRSNPKIFIGYSDITILHYAFAVKAGLRTFYGPCLISEFSEYPEVLPYTFEYFQKAVMQTVPIGSISAPKEWTDEFLDWFTQADQQRPRQMMRHAGYEWWREGSAEASIFGGAIPTINHLAGTEYWVDARDTIFFLDIPEGNPGEAFAQSELDAFLADLDNLKMFDHITGLIIGRPYQYAEEQVQILQNLLTPYVQRKKYPILFNAAIGHTAPIITIPMGARARIDSSKNEFVIIENGVL